MTSAVACQPFYFNLVIASFTRVGICIRAVESESLDLGEHLMSVLNAISSVVRIITPSGSFEVWSFKPLSCFRCSALVRGGNGCLCHFHPEIWERFRPTPSEEKRPVCFPAQSKTNSTRSAAGQGVQISPELRRNPAVPPRPCHPLLGNERWNLSKTRSGARLEVQFLFALLAKFG